MVQNYAPCTNYRLCTRQRTQRIVPSDRERAKLPVMYVTVLTTFCQRGAAERDSQPLVIKEWF